MTELPTPDREERKPYVAPALTDFGSFAEITLGTVDNTGVDAGGYS